MIESRRSSHGRKSPCGKHVGCALAVAFACQVLDRARAEDVGGTPSEPLQEITVTAQKREQSIQKVGISITAVPQSQVEDLDLKDVLRLASTVPGLNAVDGSAGQPSFRIRGVGIAEFSAAFDGPVGVYEDEVFLFKPVLSSLGVFDVKRIEVLKGPQGTVFGRNTTAGAVSYYSNTPTDQFDAKVSATYGSYERALMEGYISGPLGDNLKGRLSFQRQDDNSGPFFNIYNDRRLGDLRQNRVRGMLEWDGDGTMALLTVNYGRKVGELQPYDNLFQTVPGVLAPANEDIRNPVGRFVVNQDYFQTTDTRLADSNLRIESKTDLGTLTSISAVKDFSRRNREDTDNTPTRTVDINWNTPKLRTFSQEIRLGGDRGNWNYLFGGYYEHDTLVAVEAFDSSELFGQEFFDDYTVKTTSWALFTNNEYALTDQLSLVAGARYTSESQDINGQQYTAPPFVTRQDFDRVAVADRTPGSIVLSQDGRKDTAFNYKLGLDYHLDPQKMIYGYGATGFQSGGFDLSFGGLGNPLVTFAPEKTTAYEIGMKSSWLDNKLVFNPAVFFMSIKNYQDTVNPPPTSATTFTPRRRNAGTLQSKGFEMDLTWRASEHWKIDFGTAYTDAKIVKSSLFIGDVPLLGKQPVNAPKLTVDTNINYRRPVWGGLFFDGVLSAQWQGKRYLRPENNPDQLVTAHRTVDATLSLLPESDKWRLSLWGKNLTNSKYLLYINEIPAINTFLVVTADPITYGATVSYKF